MRVQHAAITGLLLGTLLGLLMTLLRHMPLPDAVSRIAMLAAFGALMPVVLAWLDGLLRPDLDHSILDRKEINS